VKFVRKKLLWRKEKDGVLAISATYLYFLNKDGSDLWLFCNIPRTLKEIVSYVYNKHNMDPVDKIS
jgi:hypothetical protein